MNGVPMKPSDDQLAEILHRRRVAKREAQLGLEALGAREFGGPPGVAEIEGNGLLAEHVMAGLERRPRQRKVRVAWRAHVDQIEVVASNQRLVRIVDVWDAKGSRGGLGEFPLGVGNGHELASSVAGKTWKVGAWPRCRRQERRRERDERTTRVRDDSATSAQVLIRPLETSR